VVQLGPARAAAFVARSEGIALGFVVAECTALALLAAQAGAVGQAAPFCAPLLVGEASAAALLAMRRPRAATIVSIALAGATTAALALLFDAALGVPPLGLGVGGALALVQLGCARIADHAVAAVRREDEWVSAGLDRVVWVPRALLLALLGRSEGQPSA
jgi:hypothetical protein